MLAKQLQCHLASETAATMLLDIFLIAKKIICASEYEFVLGQYLHKSKAVCRVLINIQI